MRLPIRRIWRAFPELDPYDDARCREFVKAARRSMLRIAAEFILIGVVWAVTLGLVIAALALMSRSALRPSATSDVVAALLTALVIVVVIGGPSLAALYVRDRLLRRRLVQVLRYRGCCFKCGYSLVGMTVPESLSIICPECGTSCTVDAALGVLALDGGLRVIGDDGRFSIRHQSLWTSERRRRWLRRGLAMAAASVFLAVLAAGLYEVRVRRQAAQARAEAPTAADMTALIERSRPGFARVIDPKAHAIIRRISPELDRVEQQVKLEMNLSPGELVDFSKLHGDSPLGEGASQAQIEQESMWIALSRRVFDALESEVELADELASIRHLPREVRDLEIPPSQFFGTVLPHLAGSRKVTRYMGSRMLEAVERGDIERAASTLETIFAIGEACRVQPLLIEVLVGWAIESFGRDHARQWLLSLPTREEVDAIERAIPPAVDPAQAVLAIEVEAIAQRALIAEVLGDPSVVRLAPLGGAVAQLGALGVTPPAGRSFGTWTANRDAIDDACRYWAAAIPYEEFQRATAVLPPAPTLAGAGLASLLLPGLDHYLSAADHQRAEDRALRTMIALERWRLEHGAYPERLEDLVPTLLKGVPIDPWSGRPLSYRRIDSSTDHWQRGYLLYVLGQDGEDNLGRDSSVARSPPGAPRGGSPMRIPKGEDGQLNTGKPLRRRTTEHPDD
ncbi:MAG: hypothetical protein KF724_11250 [Phycisphaeraceae bacterium]|nr:hypothetical protein [Phycisphaeraceae bacterium]